MQNVLVQRNASLMDHKDFDSENVDANSQTSNDDVFGSFTDSSDEEQTLDDMEDMFAGQGQFDDTDADANADESFFPFPSKTFFLLYCYAQ
jgi:hypothetical protein